MFDNKLLNDVNEIDVFVFILLRWLFLVKATVQSIRWEQGRAVVAELLIHQRRL